MDAKTKAKWLRAEGRVYDALWGWPGIVAMLAIAALILVAGLGSHCRGGFRP
jgi:hypothetical protein